MIISVEKNKLALVISLCDIYQRGLFGHISFHLKAQYYWIFIMVDTINFTCIF